MTDDRLPLADLLAKAGDGDFLRSVAEAVLQMLMEADVEGLIGAGRHERIVSDAHEGLKAALARVLGATWQRCRVGPLNYPTWRRVLGGVAAEVLRPPRARTRGAARSRRGPRWRAMARATPGGRRPAA